MNTREGEGFLTINGTQTQSGKVHTLAQRLGELAGMPVTGLRLSPQRSIWLRWWQRSGTYWMAYCLRHKWRHGYSRFCPHPRVMGIGWERRG